MGLTYETETVTNDDGEEVDQVVPDTLGVTAVDDYTVEIEIEQPFTYTLSVLAYSAFSVVPEGIVGDIEGYEGEMSYQEYSTNNPVGCGPFEFGKWEQGVGGEFVLDTFDDYHGEPASFDGIDSVILSQPSAIFNRFLNENSGAGGIPTGRYSRDKVSVESTDDRGRQLGTYGPLENGANVNYAKVAEPSTYYIGFNMEKVPKPVRQAMAYVVDQETFSEQVFKARSPPAYHMMPPQVYPGGASAYDSHYQG
jgi:peptide/nickel transport system substrate-binding protein